MPRDCTDAAILPYEDVQSAKFTRIPYMNRNQKKNNQASQKPKVSKGKLPDPTGAPLVPRKKKQVLNPAPRVAAQQIMSRLRPTTYFRSGTPLRKGSSCRFEGCDYLGVLTSSTSVPDIFNQPVSPGNSSLFPRLVSLSLIFGKYNFNRLRFSIVGDAPSTLGGAITLAPVYESRGTSSAMTIVDARNREQQETRKFWEDFAMDFDCGKASVPWYVLPGEGASDPIGNYFGEIHVVADTTAAATPVGQLFVEYDVEFCEAIAIGDPALLERIARRSSQKSLPSSSVPPVTAPQVGDIVRVDPTSGRISFERPRVL